MAATNHWRVADATRAHKEVNTLTARATPERARTCTDALAQRMRALARADEVRIARADLKRRLKRGETSAIEMLEDPPPEARGMHVAILLRSQRRWTTDRARICLARIPILESRTVESLTDHQREALLAQLAQPPKKPPKAVTRSGTGGPAVGPTQRIVLTLLAVRGVSDCDNLARSSGRLTRRAVQAALGRLVASGLAQRTDHEEDDLRLFALTEQGSALEAQLNRNASAGVLLINPKWARNVGGALRACSALGASRLAWTPDRVPSPDDWPSGGRLPREERMRAYRDVQLTTPPRTGAIDAFTRLGYQPVAVEVRDAAESLPEFIHPARAAYVFGPEDGSLQRGDLTACHRFVRIPSASCLNLAAAVNVVLYDRLLKQQLGN
jgi:tRNA(Leu) C34 or U34 (ribose-2'-O)-methylase TrmL